MRCIFHITSTMAFGLILLAAGCAQTEVHPIRQISEPCSPKPKTVLVTDFAVGSAKIKDNADFLSNLQKGITDKEQTTEEIQSGKDVAKALANELMLKIKDMGLNPLRVTSNMSIPQGSILITGKFMSVDAGNRRQRNFIGLDAGKAFLDCAVSVSAVEGFGLRKIIAFDVHVDSEKMPGIELTKGLAENIASELKKIFSKHGWIHPDPVQ